MKKTRWIALLLALALAMSLAAPVWAEEGQEPGTDPGNEPAVPVVLTAEDIPDPALMAAIREALALEEGDDLTQETLDTLTALDLSGTAVKDPTGLTLAANLKPSKVILPELDPTVEAGIRKNISRPPTSLTWANVRTIRYLDMTGMELATLEGIQWADNVTALLVDNAPTVDDADAAVIAKLPHLQQLQLENAALTRVPAVAETATITQLDLGGNALTSLTGVEGMLALTRLVVSGSEALTDFTCLRSVTHSMLNTLYIDGTRPSEASLTAIGALKLTALKLSDCAITDFSFLAGADVCSTVTTLDLSGNKESNLAEVLAEVTFTKAVSLGLDRTGLTDLTCLKDCGTFNALTLSENGITDLTGLPRAGRLDLSKNAIVDLSPLFSFGTIGTLNVSDNALTTLAGLPGRVESLQARNNRIASLDGLNKVKVSYLYLENNDIFDLAALPDIMDPPQRSMGTTTVTENAIVKLDGNRVDVEAWKPAVEQWKGEHIALSLKNQRSTPASPVAPPTAIGEAQITTAILLSAKSATRGSLVTVRATCENTGDADLGEHTFEVLCAPEDAVSLTTDPVIGAAQATKLERDSLAAGEHEEIIFTFKIPAGYDRNDPIRFVTRLTAGESTLSTGVAALGVYYATLSAPETSYLNRTVKVNGEATVGSTVNLYGVYEGSEEDILVAGPVVMAANNRWFTATVPADKVTADLTGLYAVVTKDGEEHQTETVAIDVNTTDVYFDHSSIVGPNGKEYGPTNSYVGFPTLIASLDIHMVGPALIPKLWLGNLREDNVESVSFTFAGKSVPAVAIEIDGRTVYTVDAEGEENFNTWTATGVQRMTATVTQKNGTVRTFTVAQFTVLIDPSGTVYDYDGVTPLAGVTVTLQEKVGEDWVDWIAEPYLQTNPVVTGADGHYGWDVPEGTYRVVMEKEDYYRKVIETYVPKSAPDNTGPIPLVVAPVHTEVDAVLEPVPLTQGQWGEEQVACTLTLTDEEAGPMMLCAFYDADNTMLECRVVPQEDVTTGSVNAQMVEGAVSAKFFLLGNGTWKPVCEALEVTAPEAEAPVEEA